MAIENLPLFSAMNREEVKPPFPHPQRPLTSQESHFAIMEKVNACIAEVNHFEQRVRYEMEQFIARTETENTGFKEAIQASYNAFQEVVQREVNNFEQGMQNNFDLYRNDIDKRVADFQTAINNEFNTLQTNVLKASNDKIAEMETLKIDLNKMFADYKATVNEIVNNFKTQVNQHIAEQDANIEKYRQYMVDNLLTNVKAVFNQKAQNGEITEIMAEVYGSERTFKGALSYAEIQAITDATNGDYYFCTTDEHYYQRTETAWVDIGNGDKLADDYEAFKLNISNELYDITGQHEITFVEGGNIKLVYSTGEVVDLTPELFEHYRYAIVDCQAGDFFLINATGGENPRTWGFLDADNMIVDVAYPSHVASGELLIAPTNATKLVINDMSKKGRCWRGALVPVVMKLVDEMKDVPDTPIEFNLGQNIKLAYNIGEVVDLTPETHDSYRYAIVDCEEGDFFILSNKGGVSPRAWGFLDSENKLISVSDIEVTCRNLLLKAPTNAKKIVINSMEHPYCYRASKLGTAYNMANFTAEEVKEMRSFVYGEPITLTQGYNVNVAFDIGEVIDLTPETVPSYKYAIVDCQAGDAFLINCEGGMSPRTWAFVDSNNVLLSVAPIIAKCEDTILIAPANANKLIINSLLGDYGDCFKGGLIATSRKLDTEPTHTMIDMTSKSGNIKLAYEIGEVVDLTPENVEHYRYTIVDCKEGDAFLLNGEGGVNPRTWGFLNENNVLLSVAPIEFNAVNCMLVAPANASKLVINMMNASHPECYKVSHLEGAIYNNVDEVKKNVEKISNDIENNVKNYNVFASPEQIVGAFVRGIDFAEELKAPLMDFKKSGDKMVHVATVAIINDIAYATYYVNTRSAGEIPSEHTARFAYAPLNNPENMVYIDLQDVGEIFNGGTVTAVYDTILLRKDDDVLYLMWTSAIDGVYYRLYKTFTISTGELSETMVNYFKVGETTVDFCTTGMYEALAENAISHKPITIDIGIMQKLSTREENGVVYYYTGCYANEFNCIIKSADLVTWEFVAIPDFENKSQFENATFVKGDKVFYFVRQEWKENTGFLTCYDLINKKWEKPVYIDDCQSRSDFFEYNGGLYLVHAPTDRNHISIMYINQTYLNKSFEVQTAKVPDYFYPFVFSYNGKLYMAFTASRQHIYLSRFNMCPISDETIISKFKALLS